MNIDKRLVTVSYHSGNGHTKKLAENIILGIEENNTCKANLLNILSMKESHWEKLEKSSAIVFGTPTYMGSVAGEFKKFMEKTSGDLWVNQRWRNKIAAGFTVATYPSGDKLNTLVQLSIFAAQHGMIWVGNAEVGETVLRDCSGTNVDGSWLGLMATSIKDKSQLISQNDMLSAKKFGIRIAETVVRWD